MKMTVNKYQLAEMFRSAGRGNQFSLRAIYAIYDHLEDVDPDWEVDVVGICCDFTEYESAMEAVLEIGEECEDEDAALEYLEERTSVIQLKNGGIVIQNY